MKTINIYTKTDLPRKIRLDIDRIGGDNPRIFYQIMEKRGYFKVEPLTILYGEAFGKKYIGDLSPLISKVDEKITELKEKIYMIKKLSFLSLIESILSEIYNEVYDKFTLIDLLKIEIFLTITQMEDFVSNNIYLIKRFQNLEIPNKICRFFAVFQSFLFDYGILLTQKLKRDYIINKDLNNKIKLTPASSYDDIYNYFLKMDPVYIL